MSAIAVRIDPLRSLAAGSIGATYTPIGSATTHLMRILHVINNTNQDVTVSADGSTDNLYVPAGSFILYDLETNAEDKFEYFLAINTQFYLKYTTVQPIKGTFYLMMLYGKGQ